jgi:hypothetical protein
MNLFTRNSPYYYLLKYLLFLVKHPVYRPLQYAFPTLEETERSPFQILNGYSCLENLVLFLASIIRNARTHCDKRELLCNIKLSLTFESLNIYNRNCGTVAMKLLIYITNFNFYEFHYS